MKSKTLMENPLKTYSDLENALVELVKPLDKNFSDAGMFYGSNIAIYGQFVGEIEALLRPLWGIFPLMGNKPYPGFKNYLTRIINGTNPDSDSFWGFVPYSGQRFVEMAALALGMMVAKKNFFDVMSSQEQDNLCKWLDQINDHEIQKNNWLFFRILVNTAFFVCGREPNKDRLKADLEVIDSLYLGNGWYCDGRPEQVDYYIGFAMHFYSMIYAKYAAFDEKYPILFKERTAKFMETFPAFFAKSGEAVPYGRSMTYRFAMSSCFGAMAFADVEGLPWGQVKYLALQNLRHWFKQDIFTATGELSVGYYYPNPQMCEGYNSFGSPYWALKSFIFLGLPEDHPFWTSYEEPPSVPNHLLIPEARGIIQRDDNHVQFFTAGHNVQTWMTHGQAKYEKFVYSSVFGFSVPKSLVECWQGSFDSTLAVSEGDQFYRVRYGAAEYKIEPDHLYIKWKPWDDVEIESFIYPKFPWHKRIHKIKTKRTLSLADGGFAINRTDIKTRLTEKNSAVVFQKNQVSGITTLPGTSMDVTAELVQTEPNTNLMTELTLIPTITAKVAPGEYTLETAVLGAVGDNTESLWNTL